MIFTYDDKFSELSEIIDTNNAGATTAWFDVSENNVISLSVWGETGHHSNHEVKIECSPDADPNHSLFAIKSAGIAHKAVGEDMEPNISISCRYVRAKVTTAEGSASTSKIIIQAK